MKLSFTTTPFAINSQTILLLPKDVSAQLPSRGMVLVKGAVNGTPFTYPLEPDGRGSHWLNIDKATPDKGIKAGDAVEVTMEPSKDWPEPEVPADLQKALAADAEGRAIWEDITPMARWDWLRWIRSTNREETRKKHVVVALSKMKSGTRRPCCFNRALCTDMGVSKSGVLLEPTHAR